MRYTQHLSNNHVLGAPAGWNQQDLPCGALPVTCTEVEGKPAMVSFWKPDADELEALRNGGAVALWIYGSVHPVVAMGVEP
jgi:hypothetical protein